MKRLVGVILLISIVLLQNASVFAETSISIEKAQQSENGDISVECSIANPNSSQAVTVISCELDGQTYSSSMIYTDQFTADISSDNKFSFAFMPASWMDPNKSYIVRVGGYGVEAPDSMLITDYKVYKLGDINGDGTVDNMDAKLLLKHISNIESLSDEQITAGDYNSDKSVDILDVIGILSYAQG